METVLLYLVGVVIFVVGLAASVALHELGHLIPGKLYNVKVTQYFVGFGRTLWSKVRGETEYGLKAIPLGGYVKLVGMLPPEKDQPLGERDRLVRNQKTGMFAQLMDDARASEYELVEPGDEDRLFYKLAWPKRVVIMLSGVAVNLVLAFLLFAVVFMGHGIQVPTTTVGTVSACAIVVTEQSDASRSCTAQDQDSPAKKAGLVPGDQIVSFNGTRVESWTQLQRLITRNDDGAAVIQVRRDGDLRTLRTNTQVATRPDIDDPSTTRSVGFLGITPTAALERQGIGYVVTTMGTATWDTLKALASLPVKIYHAGAAGLGLEERDPNGPMSVVGAGRVAGEMTSDHETPFSTRFFSVLLLLAGLNLFLGLFNLVPLPPLDGGSIAPTLYEAGRRRLAKIRKRPDPGFVDSTKLLPVSYAMVTVILLASVVLIFADIVAPVRLQ